MRNVCLALLFLLCAACARFENPIVAEDGPALDEALIGHWLFENPDGTFEMEISRHGKEGHVAHHRHRGGQGARDGKVPPGHRETGAPGIRRASLAERMRPNRWLLFRYELNTPDRADHYQDDDRSGRTR